MLALISILPTSSPSTRFDHRVRLHDGRNRLMESQSSPPGSLTQNFFIILPNTGVAADGTAAAQAETVMHAVRSALGTTPTPQVQSTVRRASLEDVAWEWYQNKVGGWAPSYAGRLKNRLETGLLAHLGLRPISGISSHDVLEAIRKTEARDVRETARRILRIASAVFRYGVAIGQCTQDPTAALFFVTNGDCAAPMPFI